MLEADPSPVGALLALGLRCHRRLPVKVVLGCPLEAGGVVAQQQPGHHAYPHPHGRLENEDIAVRRLAGT